MLIILISIRVLFTILIYLLEEGYLPKPIETLNTSDMLFLV